MRSFFPPQDQVFWYLNKHDIVPLTDNITADVVVVGGGMAGLTAAQGFHEKGLKVVLLEKNYCGAGASGKSSGFITPDSEISLRHIMKEYGPEEGKKLWDFIVSGVERIRANIKKYNLACDYQEQDTLVIANTPKQFDSELVPEHEARKKAGYESALYRADMLDTLVGSRQYAGGINYGGTFGINAYLYCSGMRKVLREAGVHIFEDSPVIEVRDRFVKTPYGTVSAPHIIMCTDYATISLGKLTDKLYHVQTFLMLSAPLSDEQIKKIFPSKRCLVWDTEMVYRYYRVTGENRLMMGGGDLRYSYARTAKHDYTGMAEKNRAYCAQHFPDLQINFEYMWPGLIGISKDLLPIAGRDPETTSIYHVTAAAGLPFAAALGNYSAEHIVERNTQFDRYFSPKRSVPLGPIWNKVLGTPLTFAISNFLKVSSL